MGRKPAYRNAEPGMLPKFNSSARGTTASETSLFAAPKAPETVSTGRPSEPAGGPMPAPKLAPLPQLPASKPKRSWFGWLMGGNRRRTDGRLVQGELRLQNVRPLQNNLRDDDNLTVVERTKGKVLYQTPSMATHRDDQNHAWDRLRGRKIENLVVKPD